MPHCPQFMYVYLSATFVYTSVSLVVHFADTFRHHHGQTLPVNKVAMYDVQGTDNRPWRVHNLVVKICVVC
jgi:hypothetical protein